jgi:hypothetical protein
MTETQILRGVPGILRPYKEYIQGIGLKADDQVIYYGCVGTCTPFVELLAIAVRGLHIQQVFVPLLDEPKAKYLQDVANVGMQAAAPPARLNPKVLVIMGGLAMPNVPITKEQIRALVAQYPGVKVVGVCFMSMFEKAGWLDTVSFDLMIDATIDPVTITKKATTA